MVPFWNYNFRPLAVALGDALGVGVLASTLTPSTDMACLYLSSKESYLKNKRKEKKEELN